METKQCTMCNEIKSVGEFYINSHNHKTGVTYYTAMCKECRKSYKRGLKSYKGYKKYEKQTTGFKICKRCGILKSTTKFSPYNKYRDGLQPHCNSCCQDKIRLWRYNVTPEQYKELYESQNGCCAICNSSLPTQGRKINIDHCHTTGKVRGLLCNNCNVGLGNFHDDISVLQSAIDYLSI
jgi:hypothetical protein